MNERHPFQLGETWAELWIFCETLWNKFLSFFRDIGGVRKINIVKDNFLKILLISNFKRDTAIQKLKCQNSNTPNINFMIIAFLLKNLWSDIEGSATECFSKIFRFNRPAKVTDFYHSLHKIMNTIWKSTFSSFKSLWMILWEWRCLRAWQICLTIFLTIFYGRKTFFCRKLYRCPEEHNSITR